MTPIAQRVAEPLIDCLHYKVREAVLRRVEQMERELKFLAEKEDETLLRARREGWSNDRLEVVFVLNSVYQHVLGPLQASSRAGPRGLGGDVPIRHGSTLYDAQSAAKIEGAVIHFRRLVARLRLRQRWLYANTCGDLLYAIVGPLEDRDQE